MKQETKPKEYELKKTTARFSNAQYYIPQSLQNKSNIQRHCFIIDIYRLAKWRNII